MARIRDRNGTTFDVVPEWNSGCVTMEFGFFVRSIHLPVKEAKELVLKLQEQIDSVERYQAAASGDRSNKVITPKEAKP